MGGVDTVTFRWPLNSSNHFQVVLLFSSAAVIVVAFIRLCRTGGGGTRGGF